MPMNLQARILVAIGAGSLASIACGGTTTSGLDASGDSSGELADSAGGDAPGDGTAKDGPPGHDGSAGGDASDDQDGAGDVVLADSGDAPACVKTGDPCTPSSVCCLGASCNSNAGPCAAGDTSCACTVPSVRRPFLVGSSLRVAAAAERDDWLLDLDLDLGGAGVAPATGIDPVTAAALARDWLKDACEEHASIAAFARFTMHLASVGAPPGMIVASQAASIDEVRHARACFALARRYGGRAMGPAPLALDGAMPAMGLAEIAALAAEEGCVGETLGALLAEAQLARTSDPVARALLERSRIVRDEARHAELAWSFVSWAVRTGGEPVRRAVETAVRRAIAETLASPVRVYPGVDVEVWRAHGRLTCADAHAISERGVREVVEPCLAAMLRQAHKPGGASAPAGWLLA